MAKLVITSKAQLRTFQTKLKILRKSLPTLQKLALEKTANQDVLNEIHQKMRQNEFSEKIIDATFVGKTEVFGRLLRTHFISNYVADNGFDVSNAREEGTQDQLVMPKKPDGVLRWTAKTGEPIYRKFSRPKGMERLLIIENTIKEAENDTIQNYQNNLASSVSKFLGV